MYHSQFFVITFEVSLETDAMERPADQRTYALIKKENRIFLLYKEIQSGAVAKSYMTNGLLIYGELFSYLLIY
jgi:hypothetical protein